MVFECKRDARADRILPRIGVEPPAGAGAPTADPDDRVKV